MSRNPDYCPHNILDIEDGVVYCCECGIELPELCPLCREEWTANCNNGGCDE